MVKLAIWGGGTPKIIHAVDDKAKMNCKSFIEESILHANSAREITPNTDQVRISLTWAIYPVTPIYSSAFEVSSKI